MPAAARRTRTSKSAMTGKSIEVINTDAEGAFLADAVAYCEQLGCSPCDAADAYRRGCVAISNVTSEFLVPIQRYGQLLASSEWPAKKCGLPLDDNTASLIRGIADSRTSPGKGGGAIVGPCHQGIYGTRLDHLDIAEPLAGRPSSRGGKRRTAWGPHLVIWG